jgi:hypothetical protein
MNNPYIAGSPIRSPRDFYGRKDEVREIFSLIKKQQSISLTGQRRIGRTSILHHITNPEIIEEYLSPESYIVLYIDFEGLSELTQTQFWKLVLLRMKKFVKELESALINNLLAKENLTTMDIYTFIEEFSNRGIKLVFCLDEFESVVKNTNFTPSFFSNLRYLVSSYPNITYITVSRRNLKELTHSEEVRSSPFFNIFHEMRIGFLTMEDTKLLISKSSEDGGMKFNKSDQDFVFDVAHYHPFFVQAACYEIFKTRYDTGKISGEKLDQNSYEKLKEILYKKFNSHFDYYWRKLNVDEKRKLKNLCKIQIKREYDYIIENLKDFCLIKVENDKYLPFSSIFHRFCIEKDLPREPFG